MAESWHCCSRATRAEPGARLPYRTATEQPEGPPQDRQTPGSRQLDQRPTNPNGAPDPRLPVARHPGGSATGGEQNQTPPPRWRARAEAPDQHQLHQRQRRAPTAGGNRRRREYGTRPRHERADHVRAKDMRSSRADRTRGTPGTRTERGNGKSHAGRRTTDGAPLRAAKELPTMPRPDRPMPDRQTELAALPTGCAFR